MSNLVSALYHDRDKAKLAAGDLQTVGILPEQVTFAEGLQEGSGRLEIKAKNLDQAIDVRSFLEQDGAHSVEIRAGTEEVSLDSMPTVPAPN